MMQVRSELEITRKGSNQYLTHYHREIYLLVVHCKPGWLTIWRELCAMSVATVADELKNVFLKQELAFCQELLQVMLEKWNI